MYVKDVMTRSPKSCRVTESTNDAARIMWEHDCGAVPIVDEGGQVIGIVTDRDICMAAYFRGVPLSAMPVVSVMAHDVCTCDADDQLADAERLMRDRQIRRLAVVGRNGSLVGMLSLGDLAQGVNKTGSLQEAKGDSREFLQTVAAVSEHRNQPSLATSRS
jgi:CBS domain-containing protein